LSDPSGPCPPLCASREARCAGSARAELWQFSKKWTAAAGALGPSTRVLLLPGRAPQPLRVVRRAALEGRLRALLASAPGAALGLVGLEAAEAAFVRALPASACLQALKLGVLAKTMFSVSSFVQIPILCVQLCTSSYTLCPASNKSCTPSPAILHARPCSEAVSLCCAAVRGRRGSAGQGPSGCAARAGLGHAGGRARRRARGRARRRVRAPQEAESLSHGPPHAGSRASGRGRSRARCCRRVPA